MLKEGSVKDSDLVKQAMIKFKRKGKTYQVITMNTALEELESFFNGGVDGSGPQDFAVISDVNRRFVLGVITKHDLEEFVRRRPS